MKLREVDHFMKLRPESKPIFPRSEHMCYRWWCNCCHGNIGDAGSSFRVKMSVHLSVQCPSVILWLTGLSADQLIELQRHACCTQQQLIWLTVNSSHAKVTQKW